VVLARASGFELTLFTATRCTVGVVLACCYVDWLVHCVDFVLKVTVIGTFLAVIQFLGYVVELLFIVIRNLYS